MRLLLLITFFLFNAFAHAASGGVSLIYDSEVSSAVNKIVVSICKVARIHPPSVYIIASDDINAFVTQGNDLFINTGLITAFNDPDVLRGVVAHEIGHLASNHPVVRRKKVDDILNQSLLTSLLGISAALAGSPDMGMAVLLGGAHTAQRMYLQYSREQETVADRLAVKYLHEGGFSIAGFVKLTEYFSSQELYFGTNATPYMLTHPLSKERLKVIREYLFKEKDNSSIHAASAAEKEEYSRIVAKLRAFINPNEYLKNTKKDLPEFAFTYGDAIANYRKGNFAKSFQILDELIKQHGSDGYLYELKGYFLFDTGKALDAIAAYKKALSLLGEKSSVATDYAIVLIDSSEAHKNNKAYMKEAVDILNRTTDFTVQKNPYIYRKLAVAYGKLGNLGYSNLMLAEEALLLRRKKEAERFLAIARSHIGGDTKLKLKVDDLSSSLMTED